jgi:ABC-type thiamine transport system substrate-binding protein
MFIRRIKPIRIIGEPNNHRPDKWRSTVRSSQTKPYSAQTWILFFIYLVYYTDSLYKMYNDKLQNCSCIQFHYIATYKQVETNSMTMNRGGNNGSEKWMNPLHMI